MVGLDHKNTMKRRGTEHRVLIFDYGILVKMIWVLFGEIERNSGKSGLLGFFLELGEKLLDLPVLL